MLVAIMAVAVFFRFYQLENLPQGLSPAEVTNSITAWQTYQTHNYQSFYSDGSVREGLFTNLQAVSIGLFGNTVFSLRFTSALIGVLTVLGLYLLARELFNARIAGTSAFLLAISFWHVYFSHLGLRFILAPFFAVWGFYFLWRGLKTSHTTQFAISGLCWGLGMYSYGDFWLMPIAVAVVLWAYHKTAQKHFDHKSYVYTRMQIAKGFAALMLVGILSALPLGWYFYTHNDQFFDPASYYSLTVSPGPAFLLWPLIAFFIIGLLTSLQRLFKPQHEHGHISTPHALFMIWLIVGIVPALLAHQGITQALHSPLVIPALCLLAAEGIGWLFNFIDRWYHQRDVHTVHTPFHHRAIVRESSLIANITLVIFLVAMAFNHYYIFFKP